VTDNDAPTFQTLMTYVYKDEVDLSLSSFEQVIGLYFAGLWMFLMPFAIKEIEDNFSFYFWLNNILNDYFLAYINIYNKKNYTRKIKILNVYS
jgi:hypothetical protein